MLEKIIWKNVFLSKFIKKKIVSFYESTDIYFQSSFLKNPSGVSSNITDNIIYYICKRIHNNWLKHYTINKSVINLSNFFQPTPNQQIPMLFALLLEKEHVVEKFNKLVEWGLNVHKIYQINGYSLNLSQQVLWAYHEKLLNLDQTKQILSILLEKNVQILESSYLISHYEKAVSVVKEENSISKQKLIQKKKTIDMVFSWIDKCLYNYLISSSLDSKTKSLLEYLQLKRQIQEVYIEKFSGNIRHTGEELLMKKLYHIEDIIKRKHIFHNQSSVYNSLVLLFNLPEFNEKLSSSVVANCYNAFNILNNKTKRFLLSNLIHKNKDIVLNNLFYQDIDMNWRIITQHGENILGLELLSNEDFIESVLNYNNFELLTTNARGDNILHVLENLPLNQTKVKEKLKQKIKDLSNVEKNMLFYQTNNNYETPLIKAIKQRNLLMIELLLDIGVSAIKEIENVPKIYKSALDFIANELNFEVSEKVGTISNVYSIKSEIEDNTPNNLKNEQWLHNLYKNWTIEKNYQLMAKKLSGLKKKDKVIKI